MLVHASAQLALRNRLISLVVKTTGTTSIAATATGYTRSSGSFVTDGFKVGAEVLAAGFSTSGNNGYKVVTAVTAGTLTVTSSTTMAVEAEGGNESIVWGLPEGRAWENTSYTPTTGRQYIEEDYIPSTHSLQSFPASNAIAMERGLYVLKHYGLADTGIGANRAFADAVVALFAPGSVVTAGSDTVRVRSDVATWAGQPIPLESGRVVTTITIPWFAQTVNTVAA
jgi:hypothetical protein